MADISLVASLMDMSKSPKPFLSQASQILPPADDSASEKSRWSLSETILIEASWTNHCQTIILEWEGCVGAVKLGGALLCSYIILSPLHMLWIMQEAHKRLSSKSALQPCSNGRSGASMNVSWSTASRRAPPHCKDLADLWPWLCVLKSFKS